MEDSKAKFFDKEYYRQRTYELDTRYPSVRIIASVLVNKFRPEQVLDVGCARGYLVYAFQELGVESFGVDISDYAIAHSPESIRSRLQKVNVDSDELPFESETFDMIASLECMEHLQTPDHAISEMARVLKPGGIAAIIVPKTTLLSRLAKSALGRNPSHVSVLSKQSWLQKFKSHGFSHIGDFVENEEKATKRAFRNAEREKRRGFLPQNRIAYYFTKLGSLGKWLRAELSFTFWPEEHLLFRLESK